MSLGKGYSTGFAVALNAMAAAAIGLGSVPAQAQAQGQPPPVAGRPPPLSALPRILQLQPDQRAAFRAYTDAIAQDRSFHQSPGDMAQSLNTMQTPARLDAMLDQMKSDQTAFERRAGATKAFYAVLSPDQKQTFDNVTRLPTAPPQMSPPPQYTPRQSSLPQPPNPSALPPPQP